MDFDTGAGQVDAQLIRSYDSDIRLTSQTINGLQSHFAYNNDGILTAAGSMTIELGSEMGFVVGTQAGGVVDEWSYNAYGEVQEHRVEIGGDHYMTQTYARDDLGRVVQLTEAVGEDPADETTYTYRYDVEGQLDQVTKDGNVLFTYEYDDNGNRVSVDDGNTVTAAHYDEQDRLLQYGDVVYAYTADGRLASTLDPTTGEMTHFDYDALGNLLQVMLPDGTMIEYEIDGFNRRVGRKVDGIVQRRWFYADQLRPIAEWNVASNSWTYFTYAEYEHVPSLVTSFHPNGTIAQEYRIVTDHVGTVRALVNTQNGAVTGECEFTPFGEPLCTRTSAPIVPFGFAGGLEDWETGLVRFGARDYDPRVGRWTAKDPIFFAGQDTNLYRYVENQPVTLIDPSGLIVEFSGPGAKAAWNTLWLRSDQTTRNLMDGIRKSEDIIVHIRSQPGLIKNLAPGLTRGGATALTKASKFRCRIGDGHPFRFSKPKIDIDIVLDPELAGEQTIPNPLDVVLAHELLGHVVHEGIVGNPRDNDRNATLFENDYRRRRGFPLAPVP